MDEKITGNKRKRSNSVTLKKKKKRKKVLSKKQIKILENDNKSLSNLLFGDIMDEQENETNDDINKVIGEELEEKKKNNKNEYDSDSEDEDEDNNKEKKKKRPAWIDNDDQSMKIKLTSTKKTKNNLKKLKKTLDKKEVITGPEFEDRLRDHYLKYNPTTNWEELPSEKEEKEEEMIHQKLLRNYERILDNSENRLLQPDFIGVKYLQVANSSEKSKSAINSTQFHNNGQLLLTGGYDKTLRLYQVEHKKNHRVQSAFFPDLPIKSAFFTNLGDQAICTGRRDFFYSYDLVSGQMDRVETLMSRDEKSFEDASISPNDKYINLRGNNGTSIFVSNKTKNWLFDLKMNGSIRSSCFSPDELYYYTSGGDGEVYKWDMRTRKCLKRYKDDGCLCATSLAISPDLKYQVVGSKSGIVNIYNHESASLVDENIEFNENIERSELRNYYNPTPLKTLTNLTTSITQMKFNHDSQLLAISSIKTKNSFRFVHIPSLTVFSNFPAGNNNLNYVSSFSFSPNSGYIAIGNDKGKVLLYRLLHYQQV